MRGFSPLCTVEVNCAAQCVGTGCTGACDDDDRGDHRDRGSGGGQLAGGRVARLAAFLTLVTIASPAGADDIAAAGRAYGRAQAAELAGKSRDAAVLYESADRIANAPQALRGAARTRLAAGDQALAATHALELLRRYPDDNESRRFATLILARTAGAVARIDVACTTPCTLAADGASVDSAPGTEHHFFAAPGMIALAATFNSGVRVANEIEVAAGQRKRVSLSPPTPAPPEVAVSPVAHHSPVGESPVLFLRSPPPAGESPRLSRVWFRSGVVVTASVSAAAIWSGLDVLGRYRRYRDNQTQEAYEDGRRRERRTNILIGVAAASAALTVTAALLTGGNPSTERASSPRRLSVSPQRGGAVVALEGWF